MMRASRLLLQLVIYYGVIAGVIFVAIKLWPDLRGYLPIGGVEQLISQPTKNPLQASEAIRAAHVGNLGQSLFWLVVAIIGAVLEIGTGCGYQAALLSELGRRVVSVERLKPLHDKAKITRQAITKHLEVLAEAGLVRSRKSGRERIWEIEPTRFSDAHDYLQRISAQWDEALARLQTFVEGSE